MATQKHPNEHRAIEHNDNDFDMKFTVPAVETEFSPKKASVMFWIFTRNPRMNYPHGRPSITSDLLPFVSKCEL